MHCDVCSSILVYCYQMYFIPHTCLCTQTPSGAGLDALTARSSSPESWDATPYRHAELLHDGDIEELSKQLEMER